MKERVDCTESLTGKDSFMSQFTSTDSQKKESKTCLVTVIVVVSVSEVTNREAESILRNASQTSADTAVVRLRGIPFTCTEADIVHFFSGRKLHTVVCFLNSQRHAPESVFVLHFLST